MTKPISRKPLNGYPVEQAFGSIASIRAYLSEDRIRCLRCGRRLRGLSYHLFKIHHMTVDEYREIYGIPWTYGLVCQETSSMISENSSRLVADGVICSNPVDMSVLHTAQRRARVAVRDEICIENLADVNADCTGDVTRQRQLAPKRGTQECRDQAAARPQCSSPESKHRLRTIWVGKKRTGERGKMIR